MSVVAYDGKTIAADRRAVQSDMQITVVKMRNYEERRLILAATGQFDTGELMMDWYINGADPASYPEFQKTDDWSRLIVADSYGVRSYERYPIPMPVMNDFIAWGSGRDYAMGAMAMGASAEEAVEIASRFDINCGNGIDVFNVI